MNTQVTLTGPFSAAEYAAMSLGVVAANEQRPDDDQLANGTNPQTAASFALLMEGQVGAIVDSYKGQLADVESTENDLPGLWRNATAAQRAAAIAALT